LLPTAATPAEVPPEGDEGMAGSAGDARIRLEHLDRIGPFKILELLGEGGMGLVYLGEQEEPIRRKVALKLIKWGMDTHQVMARFESERQALALMNHPNIAQVYDAGATEQGRPYFVMEYIQGVPITNYCDINMLGASGRLAIFLQVCDGVQHAHQKGIIHRDIKPSNVLVTVQDNKPVPKIIDFGVAKAAAQRLTERTLHTELGQLIGTPAYMSPEQAEMTGLDVDTRTDVYSLGALLYELLVGTQPFDSRELRRLSIDEVRRRIREDEPARPSTRFSSLGERSIETARKRRADAVSMTRQLRGDLDWITMKCLEKDRTRRYSSASELAADITRHLRHEPVQASPPSRAYRVGKFVKRHRVGVASAAVVLLALLIGIAGTTVGLLRAVKAERKASDEAEAARQVSDFLVGLFRVSDPDESKGNTVTAREILDRGAQAIDRELASRPVIQGRLMFTMGRVYQNLGLYNTAAELMGQSLQITRRAVGETHLDVAIRELELAWLYRSQGKNAEAIQLCRHALKIREQALGPGAPDVATAIRLLGILLRDQGNYTEAQQLLQKSLALLEKSLGPDDLEVAHNLYHYGWLMKLTGRLSEARQSYERALKIYEVKLGPDNTTFAWCLNDLSVVIENMGDYKGALTLLEKSLAIKIKLFGPDHPGVAATLNNLGVLFWRMRDFKQADSVWQRALAIREKTLGQEHPDVAGTLHNLALVSADMGDFERAEQYYTRTLAIEEKTSGPRHPMVASTLSNLATLLESRHEHVKARAALERALAIYLGSPGSNDNEVAEVLYKLARLHYGQGEYALAEPLFERSLASSEKPADTDKNLQASILEGYAALLRKTGRADRAAGLETRAKALRPSPSAQETRR
jgi:serine/threonine protein kinase/tetratricopeptide (TPR) repeat protein